MHVQITETNNLHHRLQIIEKLSKAKIHVGLPEKADPFLKFLLRIHEHGSPMNNIPPRKVLAPALHQPEIRRKMSEALVAAVQAAWQGADPAPALESAGQIGADGVRAYIDSHIPPPNSPTTVARKGFDLPLYDTGALYRAFDFEVTWK